MALTDTAIRTAKAGEKPRKLFDERGLYLEVRPNGSKWWRLRYRFRGKEKLLSLGVYPDVSLKDARERRDAARKLLAHDADPSEHHKARKPAKAEAAANSSRWSPGSGWEWFAKCPSHAGKIIQRLERCLPGLDWYGLAD